MLRRFLAFWLLISPAWADRLSAPIAAPRIGQSAAGLSFPPVASGGSSYTGPIDVVASPTAIYALRAASAAIAAAGTQKIVNVSASETTPANVTCDIIVASNGGLGKTANCSTSSFNGTAAATFCATGSGSCGVETWYDQSGNGLNQTQQGVAPPLVFNCISSLPCIQMTQANNNYLCVSSGFPAINQPLTVTNSFSATTGSSTSQMWASNSNEIDLLYNDGNNPGLGYYAPNGVNVAGGTLTSGLHSFQAVFNGASSASDLDGTQVTGTNPGTEGFSSYICLGIGGFGANYTGDFQEIGIWPIAFSTGQMTSMNTNISSYW